jgi:hypothetical protein
VTSPAEKLRRGEFPEFSGGSYGGGGRPKQTAGSGSQPVASVSPQPAASVAGSSAAAGSSAPAQHYGGGVSLSGGIASKPKPTIQDNRPTGGRKLGR